MSPVCSALLFLFLALAGPFAHGPSREGTPAKGEPPPRAAAPAKLALIVGIDRYARGSGIPELSGSKNDAQRVQSLLVDRFGFEPEGILVLTDEQATHERIVRAFWEHLIERSGESTEALFWFSGHGSRIPDKSGVEPEGLDSSYLAYDSRSKGRSGSFDISDDELFSLRTALAAKTKRITLVTDACHSGSGVRGTWNAQVRAVPAGTEPTDRQLLSEFWPESLVLCDDDDPAREKHAPYVHIAACSPWQQALEYAESGGEKPRVHGALTYFLTAAMEEAKPGTTYRRLADTAGMRIASALVVQTPWSEGDLERALFDGSFHERPVGYPARMTADGWIHIEAGSIHGLRTGSMLAVRGTLSDEELGRAQIVRTSIASSLAKWSEEPKTVADALYVLELSRPAGQAPLSVHIKDDQLSELLKPCSDFIQPTLDRAEYTLSLDGNRAVLATAEGQTVEKTPEPRDELELRTYIERAVREEMRFRALFDLPATPGSLTIEAEFVPPTPQDLEECKGKDSNVRFVEAMRSYRGQAGDEGERLLACLKLHNPNKEDLYVTVFSLPEDRNRNQIWPQDQDTLLKAGATDRALILVLKDSDWTLPRLMRDRYLVIATRQQVDLSIYEHSSTLRGGEQLPWPIQEALLANPTRGGGRHEVSTQAGFGISYVDLWVE